MSRDIAPLSIRVPPELRERLEAAAASAGRSLNTEITRRLEASFAPLSAPKTLEEAHLLVSQCMERYTAAVDAYTDLAKLPRQVRKKR